MNKSLKKGITLASLVIYIFLFGTFTVFVTLMSNNMSERLFFDRGEAINYSTLNKLQYNMENSAIQSNDVYVSLNQISYSNGDNYTYNSESDIVYKNGGILCQNVEDFETNLESDTNAKKITVTITFNKYLNEITKTIINCVEVV